jgi:formate dehydrogenase
VIPPSGEAREEWEVIDEIAKRIGIVPFPVKLARMLGRLPGLRPTPRRLVDMLLRTGPRGDLFGLRRGGLNLAKLEREPHGRVLSEHIETGVLKHKVRRKGSRVALAPPEIADEIARLGTVNGSDPEFPLRLIGLRELRSHNSWMHNAPLLMRGGRTHALRVHPEDAERHGLADGVEVRLASKSGAVVVPVKVTDEMTPGTVALPHGWGHKGGGWRVANEAGGVNVNLLASSEPEDLEPLAGMAFLNGIPVRMEPVGSSERDADADARPVVTALDS